MILDKHDLDLIAQAIYKNGDDVAVAIARSFERLEERMDSAESRILSRMHDVEDTLNDCRQELADEFSSVRRAMEE